MLSHIQHLLQLLPMSFTMNLHQKSFNIPLNIPGEEQNKLVSFRSNPTLSCFVCCIHVFVLK